MRKMNKIFVAVFIISIAYCNKLLITGEETSEENEINKAELPTDLALEPPSILIALLVRNKAHVLPMFLSYLEAQNYPKDRIALWIRSDHNNDSSVEMLQLWLNHTLTLYHDVNFVFDDSKKNYKNESSSYDWPTSRFEHLIQLKEEALSHAQKIWADYIFYLDADVFLTTRDTIAHLTKLKLPIVSPMLLSEGLYSNFWCGMTYDYYYQRTDEYKEIYNVDKVGTFKVPMIHSAVLIDLNYVGSRYLTFDRNRFIEQQKNNLEWSDTANIGEQCRIYDGPLDDIIIFAISANCSQIPLYVNNELPFGYIMHPLESDEVLAQDLQQLINIRTNIVHDLGEVPPVNSYFQEYITYPKKDKISLDHIYMINLERRPERRQKMERLFDELGLEVEYFPAVDGKTLQDDNLIQMGVAVMSGYEDPYHHRQMTMGEIGCFLSHYQIWEMIVKRKQNEVLILEDDIRFEPYFKERALKVLEQARNVTDFDLIYFGRKRLKDESEKWVKNAENLVIADYSYWTLGYVITLRGAQKLLDVKPLEKLIPVDEFLPVMFNRHPNKTLTETFPKRDLITLSSAPLLLYPTHYTGETGYISDTEDSEVTSNLSPDANAQLKSDRELVFPPIEDNDTIILNLDESDRMLKNEWNAAYKMHEEF